MFILSGTCNQDVIKRHESKRESFRDTFHKFLEGLGSIFAKGILRNSHKPKGVIIAIFVIS